jgi:hypothetical protein
MEHKQAAGSTRSSTSRWRLTLEFLVIVFLVIVVQYTVAWLLGQYAIVTKEKTGEVLLGTFASALTLLISTWVAYHVASDRQKSDNLNERRSNTIKAYMDYETPAFAQVRQDSEAILSRFQQHRECFSDFYKQLSPDSKAPLRHLFTLFKKLHIGVVNDYFDAQTLVEAFGAEIVYWQDRHFKELLKETTWQTRQALLDLRKFVSEHADQAVLKQWEQEAAVHPDPNLDSAG